MGETRHKIAYALKNLHEFEVVEIFQEISANSYSYKIHPNFEDIYLRGIIAQVSQPKCHNLNRNKNKGENYVEWEEFLRMACYF